MFQYAFGKMLALKNGALLKLDTTLLRDRSPLETHVYREYDLDIFDTEQAFASKQEVEYFNGMPGGSVFQRASFKLLKLVKPRNLVVQNGHAFIKDHLFLPDNTCLAGRWQSSFYFKDAEEKVRKDFSIKTSLLNNSEINSAILRASSAVAIHVRRGDYISNELYKKNIGALDLSYYKNAVSYLNSKIQDAECFVFSDDIEWCESNLGFLPRVNFVRSERSKKGMANDLHSISSCKHHIISNSTFSWWGAYLSKVQNKIVIAPKKWALNQGYAPPYIIPDSWKIIE